MFLRSYSIIPDLLCRARHGSTALTHATANQNDIVFLLPGISGSYDYLDEALDWNKDYVHLIGISAAPQVGNRARIANTSGTDIAELVTVSANGCLFKDILIGQMQY